MKATFRTALEHLFNLAAVMAVCVMGYASLRPGGFVRAQFRDWQSRRAREAALDRLADTTELRLGDLGRAGAVDTIVIFSDYQCPFCFRLDHELDSLGLIGSHLSVRVRHFPLENHTFAQDAAKAAICAEQQSYLASYHRALFQHDWSGGPPNWLTLARESGLKDLAAFEVCLRSAAVARRLAGDMALGRQMGISGTPTIVLDRTVLTGYVRPESLLAVLSVD